jgi:hypothetical protein
MKSFVKSLDSSGPEFSFSYEKFPKLNMDKIKGGIVPGLKIHQVFRDPELYLTLSDDNKTA